MTINGFPSDAIPDAIYQTSISIVVWAILSCPRRLSIILKCFRRTNDQYWLWNAVCKTQWEQFLSQCQGDALLVVVANFYSLLLDNLCQKPCLWFLSVYGWSTTLLTWVLQSILHMVYWIFPWLRKCTRSIASVYFKAYIYFLSVAANVNIILSCASRASWLMARHFARTLIIFVQALREDQRIYPLLFQL